MVGTYQKVIDGTNHYYCEHHKPKNALLISGMKRKSEFEKIIPLLSIFGLIIVLTGITMFIQNDFSLMKGMMLSMAYFFLVFGIFKVINLHNFVDAYMTYDILAMKFKTYAYMYPFIEITLGIMYFFYLGSVYRDIFTFIFMSISMVGVWKALKNKDEIPCACLGMVFTVPMTRVTLFENLFMVVMALVMVFMYLFMGSMGT